MSNRHLILVVGLVFASFFTVGWAAENGPLAELVKAHTAAGEAVDAERKKRLFKLKVGYESALKKLESEAAKSGDLDRALLARKERTSYRVEPLTKAEMEDLPPAVAKLRKIFEAEVADNTESAKKRRREALQEYEEKLLALQQALTKAEELDAAAAVRDVRRSTLAQLEQLSSVNQVPTGYDLHLSFDERVKSGTSMADSSPSKATCKSVESGWVAGGYRGGGYQIFEAGHTLLLDPEPPFSEDAFTVAAWVGLGKHGPHARVWDQFNHGGRYGFTCTVDQGRPKLEYWDRKGEKRRLEASRSIPTGEWHHLAYTFGAEKCAIYIDGEPCGETAALPIKKGKSRVLVGAEHLDGFHGLQGVIDDLIHYSRALSPEEVTALFEAVQKKRR